MAKTFEALKRSEKETGNKSWDPPETPAPQAEKATPLINEGGWEPEISPLKPKRGGLVYTSDPAPEYPAPESPSVPREMMKFKGISATVEEYRKMKYKILSNGSEKAIKTILFCSSHRGEGSSTVFLNFGQTLAAEGYRVLMVDADLRHPSLHRLFRLEKENGLTDLCFGNSSLENVMKKTMWDNLWVVTGGNSSSNPSSVFESEYLDSSIEQMKTQADWVLFDSPPLNSCSDAIALAGKVDGVVLVVQAERTRREVALQYKDRLEKSGAHILGVVLNKRRFHIPDWVYKRL
jgi:capsular exopolysaccharide synthesis family protein